jgi:hypothetical protein
VGFVWEKSDFNSFDGSVEIEAAFPQRQEMQ